MARLLFNADDVRRVVEHSIAAPRQRPQTVGYDEKTGNPITKPVEHPSVMLVHDDGVYLMSNGEPRDVVQAEITVVPLDDPELLHDTLASALGEKPATRKTGRSFCAHAKGCDPGKDKDWWDRSRELVGGDDFAETLPWAQHFKAQLDRGAKQIAINYSETRISIGTPKW